MDESPQSLASKDGNGSVLDRISAGFEFRGFGFGYDFSPMVFGFGPETYCSSLVFHYPMDNRFK